MGRISFTEGIVIERIVALSLALVPVLAGAQSPAACASPEGSQFDFWLGDWDVFRPDGKLAGTNRIERLYGCGLHENWNGANGKVLGQSFNRWDADRGVWHQTWVDSQGGLLLLEGAFRDGSMVMSDAGVPGRKPSAPVNEIRWTPQPDGSVRQLWRTTVDGGATWKTAFDGKYVKKRDGTRP